jgi:dTDP-glucose 4,6-dehydratase
MLSSKKRVLITGGAGFVGHHLVEGILKSTSWDIYIIDRLDLSGNLERLRDMTIWEKEKDRVRFFWHDLKSPIPEGIFKNIENSNYVWHIAASSHVDRSIEDPTLFVLDNVLGTTNLLLACKKMPNLEKILYFSTDEVFGPAPEGTNYKEWDRYNSGNPYAASKAGGEEMAVAFANTYKLPVMITHTMNIFGERQHPEKFIPLVIKKVLKGETVTVHANKDKTKSGSRFYIHARNVCDAVLFLMDKECLNGSGIKGKYNIVGEKEISNLEMAKLIARFVGKPIKYKMVDFHSSRPGHDLRYGLDGKLMNKLGWKLPKTFEQSLEKTVRWYLRHKKWLNL